MAHGQSARRTAPPRARPNADRRRRPVGPPLVVLLPRPAGAAPARGPIGERERKFPMKLHQFFSTVPKALRVVACAVVCCAVLIELSAASPTDNTFMGAVSQ